MIERTHDEELLTETQLIESQPLADRAVMFEHLYDRMLADLQRSDERHHDTGAG